MSFSPAKWLSYALAIYSIIFHTFSSKFFFFCLVNNSGVELLCFCNSKCPKRPENSMGTARIPGEFRTDNCTHDQMGYGIMGTAGGS